MSSPQEVWQAIPPVTRAWIATSVLCTSLVSFGTLHPSQIALVLPLVYQKLEIWRLLTAFLFFGKFSFGFLINMFILGRFGTAMETDPFKTSVTGGSADFVFSLLCMGAFALVVAWLLEMYFMGQSLLFGVLYLWSKRNPDAPTSIWGFRIKGAHLPWALMAFTVVTGGSPVNDLIGIFIGHIYYFMVEVVPLSQNRNILHTPDWLTRMVTGMTGQPVAPGVANRPQVGGHNWGRGGRMLGVQ